MDGAHGRDSALAHELDRAREEGTLEVVRLCRRRHPPVRATVLPDLFDGDVRDRLKVRAVEEMAWWMDAQGEP